MKKPKYTDQKFRSGIKIGLYLFFVICISHCEGFSPWQSRFTRLDCIASLAMTSQMDFRVIHFVHKSGVRSAGAELREQLRQGTQSRLSRATKKKRNWQKKRNTHEKMERVIRNYVPEPSLCIKIMSFKILLHVTLNLFQGLAFFCGRVKDVETLSRNRKLRFVMLSLNNLP